MICNVLAGGCYNRAPAAVVCCRADHTLLLTERDHQPTDGGAEESESNGLALIVTCDRAGAGYWGLADVNSLLSYGILHNSTIARFVDYSSCRFQYK